MTTSALTIPNLDDPNWPFEVTKVLVYATEDDDGHAAIRFECLCVSCDGLGFEDGRTCGACDGEGSITHDERILTTEEASVVERWAQTYRGTSARQLANALAIASVLAGDSATADEHRAKAKVYADAARSNETFDPAKSARLRVYAANRMIAARLEEARANAGRTAA